MVRMKRAKVEVWKEILKEYRVLERFLKKENYNLKVNVEKIIKKKDKLKAKTKILIKKVKKYHRLTIKFCRKYRGMRARWHHERKENENRLKKLVDLV